MDRLHVVIVAALAAVGCKEGGARDAPASGRVNAVRGAEPEKPPDPSEFCDVHHPAGGPALELPELAEPVEPSPKGSWRWVNVWATWCKPCVEELPLLRKWVARLGEGGAPVDLVLLSVDETKEAVADFAKKHGSVSGTGRLTDPEAIKPWLAKNGLDEGAPLPIHLLVDPAGKIRCLRAGAVSEDDYRHVAAVIRD